MDTLSKLSQLSQTRADVYSFLSYAFSKEVDKDFWDRLVALDTLRLSTRNTKDDTDLPGYRELREYVRSHPEAPLTDLSVDFAALFLGMGQQLGGAFPYESVYTSEEGLMMQEARDDMLRLLRSKGLRQEISSIEGEDHISSEFAYLAFLSQQTISFLKADDSKGAKASEAERCAFFSEHIVFWVPRFCEDVQELAHTSFYHALATITADFIETDRVLSFDEESQTKVGGLNGAEN